VEEHFYLLLPAILLLARRSRVIVLSSMATLIICWRGHAVTHGMADGFRTDQRLDALLVPAILAILLSTSVRDAVRPYLQPLWVAPWCVLLVLFSWYAPFGETVFKPLYLSALVASTMLHPSTLGGQILESHFLRFVGRISYGLYLWQQLFFVEHFEPATRPLSILQVFPFNWISLFGVAIVSYYLLERPLLEIGHRVASPFRAGDDTVRLRGLQAAQTEEA